MHHFLAPRRSQRGVTLIIAMLMLVVIGIMSVAIMRNATSSDQVANNNRLQAQANQAAQMALRFCEDQLVLDATGKVPPIRPKLATPAWQDKKNWTTGGAHMAYTLSAADVSGGTANFPAVPPQCISEESPTDTSVYTITARGFSNDFRADSTTYATKSGAVVWLQSTVYMP